MIDALAEFIARFVGGFLVEVIFYSVFYPLGWLMLKIVTFGRYPPPSPQQHNRDLVAGFPLVVIAVGVTLAYS
jgi:hypothetical protein